jgi:outer membrane protein assembly factor BamB
LVLASATGARPGLAAVAHLSLNPAAGPPASKVRTSGTGFGSAEMVVIAFDSTQIGTAATDQSGSFSTRVTVPASAPPGTHAVAATGQTSGLTAQAAFIVRTNWSQFAFDAAHTGSNPFENVIDISNVSGLAAAWTSVGGTLSADQAAVANGVLYIGSENRNLFAFDATGTANCSGAPKTCQPLWTGTTGGSINATAAVSGGRVYISSEDGRLYAFDAKGMTNCSGTPKTCAPIWTSTDVGIFASSPAVAGGVVYVAGGSQPGKLFAFDAKGVTNCSGVPKTCDPMWTGETSGKAATDSSPAVANGLVYVGSSTTRGGGFDAFDARGVTNCSGTPKTCAPLWTGTTGTVFGSPTVANGLAYIITENFSLLAFDAAGVVNCSGTPKSCSPVWTSATQNVESGPVVMSGTLYVGTFAGLEAFDAAGSTNCSVSPPRRCSPLWTGVTQGLSQPYEPAGANGLVYISSNQDPGLNAFDATGSTGCSGTPTTCLPVWTEATGSTFTVPIVVNGTVYVRTEGGVAAFTLP